MKVNKLIILAIVVVAILVAAVFVYVPTTKYDDITGVYNISEYYQYSMENGELKFNYTGDKTYDTEFIEITSCEDGIFTGYCCLPLEGEENPEHYRITGTYNKETGMIQYTCTYNYPSIGLYDWVHGSIKDGVMHLSGFTFGEGENYYASFQFTFVKEGYEQRHVSFDPVFGVGDSYSSFKVLRSVEDEERESTDPVSFGVKDGSHGLYYMDFHNPGSYGYEDLVGATIADGFIIGIGYEDGEAFSVLISNQGDYVQISREYTFGPIPTTWTAYLTEDGEPVEIQDVRDFNGTFHGTVANKHGVRVIIKDTMDAAVKKVSNSLVKVTMFDETLYGNVMPYDEGYVIAISLSYTYKTNTVYYFGFVFIDDGMEVLTYSGIDMSDNGELTATYYKGFPK